MSPGEETTDSEELERLDTRTILDLVEADDPHVIYDKPYISRIASMEVSGDNRDLSRVMAAVTACDALNSNRFRKVLTEAVSQLEENQTDDSPKAISPTSVSEPGEERTWSDVEEVVMRHFGQRTLHLVEALCANITILVFADNSSCPMLFLEGPSSTGKTTAIRFTEGTDEELLVRVDQLTPSSFVSHNMDQTQDSLGEMDLLPQIQHRVLSVRDLGNFFSGDRDQLRKIWSTLATVADGEGMNRWTGAQGEHGYKGDFRFAFQGATTPLSPTAWKVMSDIGGRVVFHEAIARHDINQAMDNQWGEGLDYKAKVQECRDVVSDFLRTVWHSYADGYGSVDWKTDEWRPATEVQKAIAIFAKLIAHARTPATFTGNEWKVAEPEDYDRITGMLVQMARARAFMNRRNKVNLGDAQLVARLALATIPNRRRPYVRMIINPKTDRDLDRSAVANHVDVSKPTALKYMRLLAGLDLAEFSDKGAGKREEYHVQKNVEFSNVWSTGVEVPTRYFNGTDNRGDS